VEPSPFGCRQFTLTCKLPEMFLKRCSVSAVESTHRACADWRQRRSFDGTARSPIGSFLVLKQLHAFSTHTSSTPFRRQPRGSRQRRCTGGSACHHSSTFLQQGPLTACSSSLWHNQAAAAHATSLQLQQHIARAQAHSRSTRHKWSHTAASRGRGMHLEGRAQPHTRW
jgi:hypothetical protein